MQRALLKQKPSTRQRFLLTNMAVTITTESHTAELLKWTRTCISYVCMRLYGKEDTQLEETFFCLKKTTNHRLMNYEIKE